jgi:hypothetical protein
MAGPATAGQVTGAAGFSGWTLLWVGEGHFVIEMNPLADQGEDNAKDQGGDDKEFFTGREEEEKDKAKIGSKI